LASNNFAAAAVEYRQSPEAKYPAAILDLKNAVIWIRNHASDFNIDENKIAALGCSAGGTLAALLGATNMNKTFHDTSELMELSIVQAVVNIDGIVDFTHPAESGKDSDPSKPSAGKLWFGASFIENPQIWKEASPLNHVNEKSAPIIFINSSVERFHAGRDQMIEKLKTFNIHTEIFTIENTPHTFWLFHPWFGKTAEAAAGNLP
jgi:pectinesterase